MKRLCIVLSILLVFSGCTSSQFHESEKLSQTSSHTLSSDAEASEPASAVPSEPASAVPSKPASAVSSEPTSAGETMETELGADIHAEPPQQLWFDGYDSIAELYEVLEKSDKEIEEYLDQPLQSFIMNGLATKADIEILLKTLSAVSLPVSKEAYTPNIIIYPERNEMTVNYRVAGETYSFTVSMESNSASRHIESLKAENKLANNGSELLKESALQKSSELLAEKDKSVDSISVYSVIVSDAVKNSDMQIFAIDASGTLIVARVSSSDTSKNTVDSLLKFDYTTDAIKKPSK